MAGLWFSNYVKTTISYFNWVKCINHSFSLFSLWATEIKMEIYLLEFRQRSFCLSSSIIYLLIRPKQIVPPPPHHAPVSWLGVYVEEWTKESFKHTQLIWPLAYLFIKNVFTISSLNMNLKSLTSHWYTSLIEIGIHISTYFELSPERKILHSEYIYLWVVFSIAPTIKFTNHRGQQSH